MNKTFDLHRFGMVLRWDLLTTGKAISAVSQDWLSASSCFPFPCFITSLVAVS